MHPHEFENVSSTIGVIGTNANGYYVTRIQCGILMFKTGFGISLRTSYSKRIKGRCGTIVRIQVVSQDDLTKFLHRRLVAWNIKYSSRRRTYFGVISVVGSCRSFIFELFLFKCYAPLCAPTFPVRKMCNVN